MMVLRPLHQTFNIGRQSSMIHFTFAFLILLQVVSSATMWSEDYWNKLDGVDLSHLMFWEEFPAVSKIGCLLQCHRLFARGCGYLRTGKWCRVYLDSDERSNLTAVTGMEYYVIKNEVCQLPSLVQIVSNPMPWLDASSYCEDLGGHLYIMDTAVKRQELIRHFECSAGPFHSPYWMGLSDRESEGIWLWIDGGNVARYWKPVSRISSQDCGILKEKDFLLYDRECFQNYHFVCAF